MKFQPGQSGNPAGRPLGARNKKTIAMEEEVAKHAQETVEIVMRRARGGDPTCLRLLMARIMPTGIDRPLALELPKVECAGDAQKALDMVIEAFGRGAITVREFSPMLGSVDRMARVAERIQQNRERERERYGAQRVHGVHPDMLPKVPPGWTDPDETLKSAIERGENPFPDDPEKLAYILEGEELFPPVNSDGAPLARAARDGGERERSAGVPGEGATGDRLYSPVNFQEAPSSQSDADLEREAIASRNVEAASEPLAPPLPRAAGEGGDPGLDPGEPAGGSEATAAINDSERELLYLPVNSGADGDEPVASENRPDVSDGRRLVSALVTAEGRPMPVYLDLKPDPDPLAEVWRMVESMASEGGAAPPQSGMIGSSK